MQGGRFQFNEGSIIYDRDVSALGTWGEKLKAISFYIVINSARPVSLKLSKDEATGLRVTQRNPGLVAFTIFTCDHAISDEMSEEITMTQDEFVTFAITGKR